MSADGGMMRQIGVEKLFDDNQARLGMSWLAGRQGGNRVLTGEAALKPTIGQVGHMNFIHPFRIQILGAAENAWLRGPVRKRAQGLDLAIVHDGTRRHRRRQRRSGAPPT